MDEQTALNTEDFASIIAKAKQRGVTILLLCLTARTALSIYEAGLNLGALGGHRWVSVSRISQRASGVTVCASGCLVYDNSDLAGVSGCVFRKVYALGCAIRGRRF